jgi:demethylmenaquinone methyltransferase / 2-methoxy-6-polyprenyl-1,4-benzoquinol methylase
VWNCPIVRHDRAAAGGRTTAPGPERAEGRDNRFTRELFSPLPERYDRLAEWLSFGQNGRWRRAMVRPVAESAPGLVLDVATGTAGVALELVARTRAGVVGVDLTEAMVRTGRRNVERAGAAARVHLTVGRAEQLPFPSDAFDALTFTYLLRYVEDPAATLGELARVVRPGGVVANLEFLVPRTAFWRAWWWLYTRGVLPAAGAVTGGREWYRVGRFLGPSISAHYRRYPLDWTVEAWRDVGLTDVTVRRMSLGGGLVMWGTKRG